MTQVRQEAAAFRISVACCYNDGATNPPHPERRSCIRLAGCSRAAQPPSRDSLQQLAGSCVHVRARGSVSAVVELGTATPTFRPECLGAHFQTLMRLIRREATEWKEVIICMADNQPAPAACFQTAPVVRSLKAPLAAPAAPRYPLLYLIITQTPQR